MGDGAGVLLQRARAAATLGAELPDLVDACCTMRGEAARNAIVQAVEAVFVLAAVEKRRRRGEDARCGLGRRREITHLALRHVHPAGGPLDESAAGIDVIIEPG